MPNKVTVSVKGLRKEYTRYQKRTGFKGFFRDIVHPQIETVQALQEISFELRQGEILGLIGPNGAGKTTTLKILSGVLYPDGGQVVVLGQLPQKRTQSFLRSISFFTGNRGFLQEATWDLSVLDGFIYVKDIYGIPNKVFQRKLDELTDLLQIKDLLRVPLRQLSHGQRVRAELVGALLWDPELLLLDEPTIGIDIVSQQAVWNFVKAYVSKHQTSTILTSHYIRDLEELADRLLILNEGVIVYDGPPSRFISEISPFSLIKVKFEQIIDAGQLIGYELIDFTPMEAIFRTPTTQVKKTVKKILDNLQITDISIEEPDLEIVLKEYFTK